MSHAAPLVIKLSKKKIKKFRRGDASVVADVEAKKAAANHTGTVAVVQKKDKKKKDLRQLFGG